jgi:hypothetical protein
VRARLYSAVVVGNICSEAENVKRKCKMLHRDEFNIINFSVSTFIAINYRKAIWIFL